jgi:acetyltransferase-like isoleucine patch superfamily enzyme/ubiquinone/menaquinone biosynthesis C-methylase UbiE
MIQDEAIRWQKGYWDELSQRKGLRPVIDPKDMNGAKNARFDSLHKRAVEQFLRRLGLRFPLRRVLDFGCGIGRHRLFLSSLGTSYVGVDIAPGMLARNARDTCQIDGVHLPFADGSFNLVFSFWVLQHVVEDQTLSAIVREMSRCLSPDGAVVICERSSQVATEPSKDTQYIHRRLPKRYVDLFREEGLELQRITKLSYRRRGIRQLLRRRLGEGEYIYAFRKSGTSAPRTLKCALRSAASRLRANLTQSPIYGMWCDLRHLQYETKARAVARSQGASVHHTACIVSVDRLKAEPGVYIDRNAYLHCGDVNWCAGLGEISIGTGSYVGPNSVLFGMGEISIGREVLISPHVVITSVEHPVDDTSRPIYQQARLYAPVSIADDVYVGAGAVITPGVSIGRGAVVAAGAVVTKDVAPLTIVAGVPARPVRQRPC